MAAPAIDLTYDERHAVHDHMGKTLRVYGNCTVCGGGIAVGPERREEPARREGACIGVVASSQFAAIFAGRAFRGIHRDDTRLPAHLAYRDPARALQIALITDGWRTTAFAGRIAHSGRA